MAENTSFQDLEEYFLIIRVYFMLSRAYIDNIKVFLNSNFKMNV